MSTLKRKAQSEVANATKKAKQVGGSITSFFSSTPAPLSSADTTATTPTSFNKKKWVASLNTEQKQLLQLEIDSLHESWLAHLKDEVTSKEFLELKRFIDRETKAGKKVFPPKEDIYSWSRHTPFHSVKVVIVGQDPYHNHNQAHGLAFSVRPPTTAPPSLKNMFVALKKDYPTFVPPPGNRGLLTPWAEKGVLMLNTCLTVRAHEANSHSNRGWEKFTQKVIDLVAAKRARGVVFMAWGTPASKRVLKIDQKRHMVLKAVHPSPLSAHKGFFDCGHFRKANEWLVTRYGEGSEVDWSLGGPPAPKPSRQPAQEEDIIQEKNHENEESKETEEDSQETEDEVDRDPVDENKKETPQAKVPMKKRAPAETVPVDEYSEPSEDEEAALIEAAEAADRKSK